MGLCINESTIIHSIVLAKHGTRLLCRMHVIGLNGVYVGTGDWGGLKGQALNRSKPYGAASDHSVAR